MATTVFPSPVTRNPRTEAPTTAPSAAASAVAVEAPATAPNYVAIYAGAIMAMTALFFVGVAVPCGIFLESWKTGLGVGAMFAFWGGPAFGTMFGAARVSAWFEANHQEM